MPQIAGSQQRVRYTSSRCGLVFLAGVVACLMRAFCRLWPTASGLPLTFVHLCPAVAPESAVQVLGRCWSGGNRWVDRIAASL